MITNNIQRQLEAEKWLALNLQYQSVGAFEGKKVRKADSYKTKVFADATPTIRPNFDTNGLCESISHQTITIYFDYVFLYVRFRADFTWSSSDDHSSHEIIFTLGRVNDNRELELRDFDSKGLNRLLERDWTVVKKQLELRDSHKEAMRVIEMALPYYSYR